MKDSQNALLINQTTQLLIEIDNLKQQLEQEAQQHKRWKTLAMIFHDELWAQLKKVESK